MDIVTIVLLTVIFFCIGYCITIAIYNRKRHARCIRALVDDGLVIIRTVCEMDCQPYLALIHDPTRRIRDHSVVVVLDKDENNSYDPVVWRASFLREADAVYIAETLDDERERIETGEFQDV